MLPLITTIKTNQFSWKTKIRKYKFHWSQLMSNEKFRQSSQENTCNGVFISVKLQAETSNST